MVWQFDHWIAQWRESSVPHLYIKGSMQLYFHHFHALQIMKIIDANTHYNFEL